MNTKKFTALLLSGVMAASVLAGCGGIDKDAVVATLDGQEIKLGVANFAARLQQARYDDFYTAYFGEDVWNSDPYGNGATMQDNLKDSVIGSIEDMYVLKNHMDDYGVALSEEDQTAIKTAAAEFMSVNTDDALEAMGATEDIVEEYLTLVTIQTRMREAIIVDADTNVSDEEANTSDYSYVVISKTSYKDADGNTVDYTEEEKADLADSVKKFQSAATTVTLEDAADEFGYTGSTGRVASDNTTLDADVLAALQGLTEEGQVSDVVETDSSYYVLRLDTITDADKTEQHRQEIIGNRQSELYSKVLQGYKDEAEWVLNEKVWKTVTFDNLFTTTVESTETETVDSTEPAATEEQTETTGQTESVAETEAVDGTESVQ